MSTTLPIRFVSLTPLTPAEKQARYRQRLKNNKEKEEEQKRKARARYHSTKQLIGEKTPGKQQITRRQWRSYKSNERVKIKGLDVVLNDTNTEVLPPPSVNVDEKRKRLYEVLEPKPSATPINNSMREVAVTEVNYPRIHDDRFSAFGDYIASELRTLPPDRASYVQRSLNHELLRLMEAEETPVTPLFYQSPAQFVTENVLYSDSSTIVVTPIKEEN